MGEPSSPLVSIIVPCYNDAGYLGETLDNVLAQTWSRWECLVVDDGSTDQTPAVVAAYARNDPRFQYLHQQHAGPSAARNTGLRHAQGQFIQFLDADDALASRKLENQLAIFQSSPAADIVFSWVEFFGTANARKKALYASGLLKESKSAGECLKLLVHQNILVINVPLIRKALIDQVGLFDETLLTVEDWNYWLRCALAGARFEFDDAKASRARVRLRPRSHSTDQLRMFRDSLQVRQKLATDLANSPPLPERVALMQFNQKAIQALIERLDKESNTPQKQGTCPRTSKALGWLRKVLSRT
jgi:glycosyltransferase involved in cell wall biosynthesis